MRIKKGAPVGFMLSEGIATIIPIVMPKDPPHPNSALLYTRWSASRRRPSGLRQGRS